MAVLAPDLVYPHWDARPDVAEGLQEILYIANAGKANASVWWTD